jgi:two-component system sensor histidine kinase BaeS
MAYVAQLIKRLTRGIAARIALGAFLVAVTAIAIVAIGVLVAGGEAFAELMVQAGETAAHAHAMYDATVGQVVVAATVVAIGASTVLALLISRRLARPLDELARAARHIARGDYGTRVPGSGPEEVVGLADSFNQMSASLEEQERIRREFIVNAAHELRTPLTNLQGYLEALRDGVLTPDQATYESLWEEADRLVRLARSLDTIAEGGRPPTRPKEVDLVPVLAANVDLILPALTARDVRLERRWPTSLPVNANRDELSQVLGNLLQNAARYTPPGGEVAVAAAPDGDVALVSVSNTGEAISDGEIPRLFERFYRLEKSRDRARGGAGIGLAIVRQLVEAAGGTVGAESANGRNRFWFTVPMR